MDPILPHLERARTLAERIGDRERLALAALYESGYHWIQGKHQLAIEAGMRGLTAAEELDSWELRGLARYRIGQALLFLGDHVAAADHFRRGVAALDHDAGRTLLRFGGLALAFIASFTAWTLAELGEFSESEAVGQMGFELAVKANHAYSISVASFGLTQGWIRQGRFADAIRVLEQGLEQTKLHSVEAAVDQVVSRLVYAYSRAGELEEARTLGQTMSAELARFSFLSSSHFLLAGIGLENDGIDATLPAARELHQTATLRGERGNVAWLEHLLGDLACAASQQTRRRPRGTIAPLPRLPTSSACYHSRWNATSASVPLLGGKAARMKLNRSFNSH
jgi:tetratricopeptide (TPR) repeat protein